MEEERLTVKMEGRVVVVVAFDFVAEVSVRALVYSLTCSRFASRRALASSVAVRKPPFVS